MEQQRAVESHRRSAVAPVSLSPASSSLSSFPVSWLHHSLFLPFAFSLSTFSFFCVSLSLSVCSLFTLVLEEIQLHSDDTELGETPWRRRIQAGVRRWTIIGLSSTTLSLSLSLYQREIRCKPGNKVVSSKCVLIANSLKTPRLSISLT